MLATLLARSTHCHGVILACMLQSTQLLYFLHRKEPTYNSENLAKYPLFIRFYALRKKAISIILLNNNSVTLHSKCLVLYPEINLVINYHQRNIFTLLSGYFQGEVSF